MDTRAEELERRARRQRSDVEETIEEIGDRVSPRGVYERQRRNVRQTIGGWKESVMGSPAYDSNHVSDAVSSESGLLDRAGDTLAEAPAAIERHTRGNPLAAGLIAFGAGLLAASVAPPSDRERRMVAQRETQVRRVAEDVKDAAQEVGSDLKDEAKRHIQEVKESAADSLETVKDEASDRAKSIKDKAEKAADRM